MLTSRLYISKTFVFLNIHVPAKWANGIIFTASWSIFRVNILELDMLIQLKNESKARVKFNLMERMLQPCGPPPEKPED
ncbi:unnamed protein product [Parnassius apollo]|uniref:(apollo) hypothetical protein n=1 Tax=Parnassius apollo TaxID=110799 RepID=A0A8S3Y5Z1_PARAO|nr:unnamed protein product [Parnassius apollo]